MAPNAAGPNADSAVLSPARDLSRLLVPSMRVHQKSPLKAVMGSPTLEMINMAGGMPSPATFPLVQLQAQVRVPGRGAGEPAATLVLDKERQSGSAEALDTMLQYGDGRGVDSLCSFLRAHTQQAHSPQYADWEVITSCGSTDAIAKVISLFCDAGDALAVERWTFPGALSSLARAGVAPVAVDMDDEGMLPEALDRVCAARSAGGAPLHAVYVVPTGQNPTGATMSLARRKAVYAVAQKHDLVIIEDDPYYFLQIGPAAAAPDSGEAGAAASDGYDSGCDATGGEARDPALLPSLLSLDTDGRVIRLDSFSKILAPNLRCGWITGPAYLLDRVQILNESTILQPSGLSQGVVSKMLNDTWGMDGWNAHLRDLRAEYRLRRDLFVQIAAKHLDGLAEFAVPTAGMFVWLRVRLGTDPGAMQRLLAAMNKVGVMMAPEMPFNSCGAAAGPAAPGPDRYLRAAFALVDTDMYEPALKRLAQSIRTATA
ncbi:hypothetical protein H4R18_004108 [Coemansia javaensis]|uniref:Aminotransferase class I/classII large domain-containing protein n=1 Tax=Coemansia javaensis TaxID=2761396 RepID=A0A9W8LGA1_9FUNG|nr:hypothetical protein H4R18_004108 [Coemansia javaensis]